SPCRTSRDDESFGLLDLAIEVPGIELDPPHRLVHLLKITDREGRPTERCRERRMLKLCSGAFDTVRDNPPMVKGEFQVSRKHSIDRLPPGVGRVRSGSRLR